MRVQKIVIMSAAQIGKTDALILNPIGYYMHYDPSPIMVMQPTIQMAETWLRRRFRGKAAVFVRPFRNCHIRRRGKDGKNLRE